MLSKVLAELGEMDLAVQLAVSFDQDPSYALAVSLEAIHLPHSYGGEKESEL